MLVRNVKTLLTTSIINAFISGSEIRDTSVQGISPKGVTTFTADSDHRAHVFRSDAAQRSDLIARRWII